MEGTLAGAGLTSAIMGEIRAGHGKATVMVGGGGVHTVIKAVTTYEKAVELTLIDGTVKSLGASAWRIATTGAGMCILALE